MIVRKIVVSLGLIGLVISLFAALSSAADAGKGDIHIAPGHDVSWNWRLKDGAGYLWDISSVGMVNDGSNDCYDGGMRLSVNGGTFSWSSYGRLGADGREVEIGPWTVGAVRVWRRIYVDPKLGYCRWIDIFENTSAAPQQLKIQYYTNTGGTVQATWTTGGKAALEKADWGIVTAEANPSSSRPAIAHVFATRGARIRPAFRWTPNNDNMYYDVTVRLGAKKTSALCFFEAQRRPFQAAKAFLKKFDVQRELQKVPRKLRRLIVNMPAGSIVSLGDIVLARRDKRDLVVLRNDDEMLGSIVNKEFVIDTFYGRLTIPAARVVGLLVPSRTDPHVQVVLADGQVVAGKLLSGPLKFKLAGGNKLALPLGRIKSASFRISPARPEKIAAVKPLVVLRSHQRLFYRPKDLSLAFYTEFGRVKLKPEDLREILLDTPRGGLHLAVFTNGSTLSGLLEQEQLNLKLDLGPTLSIPRPMVSRFVFASAKNDSPHLAILTLRNENTLRGRLVGGQYVVATHGGDVTIKPKEIARIDVPEGSFERVSVALRNGSTVTGRLKGRTLRFRIEPGPELTVFVGHVKQLVCPSPAASAKLKTNTKPAPTATGMVIKSLAD